jgi:hypothetical protein
MTRSTISVLAMLSALAIGTSVAEAGPGKGRGHGGGGVGASKGWSGTPPGFSARGQHRGWVDGRPRGWTKGKRKGWGTRTTPPGWRDR